MSAMTLKQCPFCGSAAVLHHPTDKRMGDITYVLCDGCGAVTSFRPNLAGSKCVAAWNARAHLTAHAQMVEKVREVIADIRCHCDVPNPESDDELSATYALSLADKLAAAIGDAHG